MNEDYLFMQRALELAQYGAGKVSPNPMVGCVIVHEGKIIGEGWHQRYGGPHAEVHAVEAVADKEVLKESTVYVSLEPCSHTGKTPPCADLLIKHQIKRVVVCHTDPNELVAGKGIKKLQEAGIAVELGLLQKQGEWLNRRFNHYMTHKRPYVILKWAQTADGFVARSNFDSKWISSPLSRQRVHQWRSEEDAILVGSQTVLHDNPQLTTRDWPGKNPIRVVLDRSGVLHSDFQVFYAEAPTLYYTSSEEAHTKHACETPLLKKEGFIEQVLADLYQRKIQSVLVEGGSQMLQAFVSENCWNEARIFQSGTSFGEGLAAPVLRGKCVHQETISTDTLSVLINSR
ncbi:bifunctional diaminohydroxyphosphoribosylaminopyrimidine deaminase/5-amino-6-(5-phosphoribosylamino)uracil reductase RibD [Cytophagales bacterium LB-30]|uniref:Riboflavin biosynthesis protein RibD n=1 Tax=Shiella aurantiaca TaxID=3058365 RepID=A0ABT8F8V3_9BACT|nr:bifunctional diaminohydroxyphosphoribosylaminopyrimidine deaminase/5-amino-6-(5-phosphoribosylamino)uracil reductase RibD [Shiella aurantiaca]MDN4166679.1 bifunctional diaminohydroxyphosphoribosylaminopyrimidine deaminase/5-amino-6-(5-phosphoribosylamino)uracil reductase RibD [Shiella aurantiaca]